MIANHRICRNMYEKTSRSQQSVDKVKTDWHDKRNLHNNAFNEVCKYVKDKIVKSKRTCLFSFLQKLYSESLQDAYTKLEKSFDISFSYRNLEENLLQKSSDQIEIDIIHNKKIVKPYNTTLLQECNVESLEKQDILQKAALILRGIIRSIPHKKLPEKMTTQDLMNGECEVPQELTDFYTALLTSPHSRRKLIAVREKLVKSLSQDLIYATTNGEVKPSKHITLGLALKRLTNCKKL